MLDAILINPFEFAQENQYADYSLSLADMHERVSKHTLLADNHASIVVGLQGKMDGLQRPCINLMIQADLHLYCQRCLLQMEFSLDETISLVLFHSDLELEKASEQDEDMDGLVATDEENILAWIEDQILLSLPYSPKHEECGNKDLDLINQDRYHPFADLLDKFK